MKILVSGLLNTETTAAVRGFPIPYYPVDYSFFGVNTKVSGVAFNVSKALRTLGDEVRLTSMTGNDFAATYIKSELKAIGIDGKHVQDILRQTPNSAVLYDPEGKRQIYCDLKDIQETEYKFDSSVTDGIDAAVICNINFNRPLLRLAKAAGVKIATDVHVLSDIYDGFNREFMECADILFLSDEGIGGDYRAFIAELERVYGSEIIVLGRGSQGAAMYVKNEDRFYDLPAVRAENVKNTVGAGDALFSAFVHFYTKGLSALDSLNRAQLFASIKIGTVGGANGFVTESELENRYAKFLREQKG